MPGCVVARAGRVVVVVDRPGSGIRRVSYGRTAPAHDGPNTTSASPVGINLAQKLRDDDVELLLSEAIEAGSRSKEFGRRTSSHSLRRT